VDFETEEQQVEALKNWWKDNGKLVITGIVAGALLIGGYRFYKEHEKTQANSASDLYTEITTMANKGGDTNALQDKVNNLMAEYAKSPYAALAAMQLARQQINNNQPAQALQQLDWVITHTQQPELQVLAKIRMARLLISLKDYDRAQPLLTADFPASFTALVEELRGDLYRAKGETDKARESYDKAILAAGAGASQWLKLKRQDLGEAPAGDSSV